MGEGARFLVSIEHVFITKRQDIRSLGNKLTASARVEGFGPWREEQERRK